MKVIKNIFIIILDKTKKLQELFKDYYSKKNKNNATFLKTIEKQYNECSEIGEKRMNLANESYFMIENEIKRINMVIEKLKFERDNIESNHFSYHHYLINKNFNEIFNFESNVNSKRRAKGKKLINDTEIFINSNNNKKFKKKFKGKKLLKNKRYRCNSNGLNDENNNIIDNNNLLNEEQKNNIIDNNEVGWEDITYKELDGKIGPKEPVYCFCNYISYGNMIKCDNPNCKREWFHFHCVGLKNQPKGKWFCSEKCAKEYMKKNPHNFKLKGKAKSKPKNI